MVQCLLAEGATIPKSLTSNLCVLRAQVAQNELNNAVNQNDFKTVSKLLRGGVYGGAAYCNDFARHYIDTKRQELFRAIEQDNIEQLAALLKQGFSINTCDKDGNTMLHMAMQLNKINVTRYLISLLQKIDKIDLLLSKKNKAQLSPLQLAVNNPEILRLLLGLLPGIN